jgi:hypothetical protein
MFTLDKQGLQLGDVLDPRTQAEGHQVLPNAQVVREARVIPADRNAGLRKRRLGYGHERGTSRGSFLVSRVNFGIQVNHNQQAPMDPGRANWMIQTYLLPLKKAKNGKPGFKLVCPSVANGPTGIAW